MGYINDLISELQKKEALQHGAEINNIRINCLLFADDIALIAEDKKGLEILTGIVGRWAKQNGLEFNTSKCNTINTTDAIDDILHLNNKRIWDTANPPKDLSGNFKWTAVDWYKYLGIPIGKHGIYVRAYINRVRGRLFGQINYTLHFCKQNRLPVDQRVQM